MPPARSFARCSVCTHAGVAREGGACLLCGSGVMRPAEAPADLFTGWRCLCYHCSSTPC